MAIRLLVIDDNPDQITLTKRALRDLPEYVIDSALDATTGLKKATEQPFDVILCDYRLPEMNGIEVLKRLRAAHVDVPLVLETSAGSERVAVEAIKEGASDYIVKDVNLKDILPTVIGRAIEHHKAKQERIRLEQERNAALEEVRTARDIALEASRAKSEFLATMSHEIRTPMNAIIGMAELLTETQLDTDQRNYVEVLSRGANNLLDLINDILDLSKVEAGRLDIEQTEFELQPSVESSIELMAVRAHQKNLELNCRIAPEIPKVLIGDPHRLRQVLVNLIGNAIKFTEKGEVFVEVAQKASAAEGACRLRFDVKDTGIGIPLDKIDKIFEPFTQADSSTTRKYGGTGLGLAISKKIIELMGGRLSVTSELGKGTTFSFTIDLGIQPTTGRPVVTEAGPLIGLKILVVDDNDANRLILREMLSRWGVEVRDAESGAIGLAELKRACAAGTPYDLMLLDCRMPDMDGFQVAQAVQSEPQLVATIMMLTSDNRKGDMDRAKQLGLARYLVKPVKMTDLRAAVETAVGQQMAIAATASKPAAATPAVRPLRILVAEDSPDNWILVQAYLRNSPHQIELAENGEIAVKKFQSEAYDLVFMDMHMPVMDGYSATKAIRQWEQAQASKSSRPSVPIIALSADAMKEDIQKSLEAGCVAHVTKPVKKETLLKTIAAYSTHNGHATANNGSPVKEPKADKESKIIVRVDPELESLIPNFLVNRRKDSQTIEEALGRGDYETVRHLGHSMKGAGRGYGFEKISEIGAQMEASAKAKDADAITRQVKELLFYLDHVELSHD